MEQSIKVGETWFAKEEPELELEIFDVSGDTVSCKLKTDWFGYLKDEVVTYTKSQMVRFYEKQSGVDYQKGYQDGYRCGHTDGKKETSDLDEQERQRIYYEGYDSGHNQWIDDYGFDISNRTVKNLESINYKKGLKDKEQINDSVKQTIANKSFQEGYEQAVRELSQRKGLDEDVEYKFDVESVQEYKGHKYPHYFKNVSHLDWVDVYQINKLFPVKDDTDCILHARKKLLVCGGRGGGKDMLKDVKEAYDTLHRYLEIEGRLDD